MTGRGDAGDGTEVAGVTIDDVRVVELHDPVSVEVAAVPGIEHRVVFERTHCDLDAIERTATVLEDGEGGSQCRFQA